MNLAKKIALWSLKVVLALMMFMAGISKFTVSAFWADSFANWGFPDHFHLVIGVLEMAGSPSPDSGGGGVTGLLFVAG